VRQPLVSIVVPCYIRSSRDGELLDETLHTVDRQTCDDYEVLLVDDGSPLDVRGVVGNHARTTIIRQPNAGPALARNRGIDASRGEYFIFLDADDHLLPHALEVGVQHLTGHPDCGFAVGPREEMAYDGQPVPWDVAPPPPQRDLYRPLLAFEWYIIPPSSAIFRRDVVMQVGGFRNPWGADDLDFYLRAARAFPAVCYQAPAVTRYRRYSASSSRDGERMLRSVREVYRRNWSCVAGDPAAELDFHRGLTRLTGIFAECLVENIEDRLRAREWRRAAGSARALAVESPGRLFSSMPRTLRSLLHARRAPSPLSSR
jgi:glycosyltransferase involved in cell wall biosynthesis